MRPVGTSTCTSTTDSITETSSFTAFSQKLADDVVTAQTAEVEQMDKMIGKS